MTVLRTIIPITLLFAANVGCHPKGSSEDEAPCAPCNVVLISIDTLRADHLSLYGYGRPTSPELEALADEAVVFDNFVYGGGSTLPSHMTMMTSLYPGAHGIEPGAGRTLQPERLTLAEELRAAGFATAGFVDAGWMRGRYGFAQGFDLYDEQGGRFAEILPRAFSWLERNRDRPFFLFLHTYDVHSESVKLPYDCPSGYAERYTEPFRDLDFDGCRDGSCASRLLAHTNLRILSGEFVATDRFEPREIELIEALYDGCINYADHELRVILDRLESLELYDETLIVILSDHGEEFAEHGLFLHQQHGFDEIARLPLILKLPRSQRGGSRVGHLAAMVDVMPTILDLIGLPVSPQAQGKSLTPSMFADEPVREETHFYEIVRTNQWKYFSASRKLYDLFADPAEELNVYDGHRETARRLEEYLGEQLRLDAVIREEVISPAGEVVLTPDELEQLRALGYVP